MHRKEAPACKYGNTQMRSYRARRHAGKQVVACGYSRMNLCMQALVRLSKFACLERFPLWGCICGLCRCWVLAVPHLRKSRMYMFLVGVARGSWFAYVRIACVLVACLQILACMHESMHMYACRSFPEQCTTLETAIMGPVD